MSGPFTYQPVQPHALHDPQLPLQDPASAMEMPTYMHPQCKVQYWLKPMSINNEHNAPISHAEEARMRQEVTRELSDLPANLHNLAVGFTWKRSAEQSIREYQLLDMAAQSIEILKAMNIMDREEQENEAIRKKEEAAPGLLKAMKYRVSPQELAKTAADIKELQKCTHRAYRVEDCLRAIVDEVNINYLDGRPGFLGTMQVWEWTIDKARSTVIKLREKNPDGHWAIELLNFHTNSWLVWLNEIFSSYHENWYQNVFDEKMEGAEQRVERVKEIIAEVEKESKGPGWW